MSVKFDVANVLKNWDGKPVLMESGDKDTDGKAVIVQMTFGFAACEALAAVFDSERGLSGEEKFKRWRLGTRITNASGLPIELASEEASLLKKVVALRFGPLFMGQIWDAIDPPEKAK